MLRRMLVVPSLYPSPDRIRHGAFVYELVQELCRVGIKVDVVAPRSIWERLRHRKHQGSYGTEAANVYRPTFVSYSSKAITSSFSTQRMSLRARCASATRVAKTLERPDIVYAHFLTSGVAGLNIAHYHGVPCVVALGEANLLQCTMRHHSLPSVRKWLSMFDGIIVVSQELHWYCSDVLGIDDRRILYSPNGVHLDVFKPRDKTAMRRKYGLPIEEFIIGFVGNFNEHKGVTRVVEAIKPYPQIKAICLGDGDLRPTGEQICFAGTVSHSTVAELLSAADIFVLPTRGEGSSNAVLEALATGLPVVSSDIPSIREQVGKDSGVLINPEDVEAIGRAVYTLYTDVELLERLSVNARKRSEGFVLEERVQRLLTWCDGIAGVGADTNSP